MSCQSASPLGAQAANTVLSRIAGTAPAVIDQAFSGACISLGRKSGIVQVARKDDTAVNVYFTGRFVAPVKEAICKGTLWALRREATKPGSAFWFKGGRHVEQAALAPQVVSEK
jgi:NADH dehydrogenase